MASCPRFVPSLSAGGQIAPCAGRWALDRSAEPGALGDSLLRLRKVSYTIQVEHLQPEAERLRVAFDLHEAGIGLMRARLGREHPDLDQPAIDALLAAWLRQRPGATDGDAAGMPGSWPRSAR